MGGEESVEIGEPGDVALNGGEVFPADLRDSIVEALLAAAGDENVGPFRDKSLSGGEAYAAVAAGDQGDFSGEPIGSSKYAHEVLVFLSDVRSWFCEFGIERSDVFFQLFSSHAPVMWK